MPPKASLAQRATWSQRAGVAAVVFPKANEVDIINLEDEVKEGLEIILADTIEPLTDLVLLKK